MKYRIDLTVWYLNFSRLSQILNSDYLIQHFSILNNHIGTISTLSQEDIACSVLKKATEDWLHVNKIPTLGELYTKNDLNSGQLFTIYHDFYGIGLLKYKDATKPIPRDAVAQIHNKLKYNKNIKLRVFYHPNNLVTQTAWSRLSGRTRLFVFAYIEKFEQNEIYARPYLIGDLNAGFEAQYPRIWNARNYGEIHPTQIDQFSLLQNQYEV